jgi:hypothetical protein
MSNAPFDQGLDRRWHALGVFAFSEPVNSGFTEIHLLDETGYAVFRIDFASVILEYAVSDGTASGELAIQPTAFGPAVPFLSAAGNPETYMVGSTPTASPYGQERICTQLSLPFYVTASSYLYVSGHGTDGSSSLVRGLVAVSGSFTN